MVSFNKERTFQEIFTDTFVFLQQQWRTFFLCITIYVAPVATIAHYCSSKIDLNNLSYNNLLLFLLFSLIANFLLQSIAYAYITCFVKNSEVPARQTVMEFFSKNILSCVKAFLISNLGIGVGFSLFAMSGNILLAIPGLIVLIPLSLYMFDRIYTNAPSTEALARSVQLTQSNIGMSFAVVLLSFFAVVFLQFVVTALFGTFSVGVQIIVNVSVTVISSILHIIISLLYFSLRNKIQKPYDNYQ